MAVFPSQEVSSLKLASVTSLPRISATSPLFLAFFRASGRAPIQVRGLESVRPSKKTAHL